MQLIVDLHCHSTVSDGLLSPEALVRRAAGNGVSLLSLTDHDGVSGLARARQEAETVGMRFVNGVEISIEWGGAQVHLLGYRFDADDAALTGGLASIHSGRLVRARSMSESLEKIGIAGCFEGAMRFAENPKLISRAHFARHLAATGVCKDVRSVFDSYLVPGKPGYVEHRWPTVAEAVGWIVGAGGIAAVAHPARYAFSRGEMRKLLDEFKQCGGQAIEVVSGSHSVDDVGTYSRIAREYGFMATSGSDFHGPDESYADLGRVASLPEGLTPVWESF
ncbi:3',5'-nucleoside bisphosphate phosphatase [Propionivibrio dicarboxylicus]|uniref:3',5'-nucleoside bisphosphate phosphatase n=1 Tax=Propionivibrio dicarboxylicus TaxID=83767 RepID=UPI000ABC1D60|nr:3',5'-nucleoside bisphosphate phosphatase [Propionivibrio dicarboxylicus]